MKANINKYSFCARVICWLLSYLSIIAIAKIFSLGSDIEDAFSGMYFGYNIMPIVLWIWNSYILYQFVMSDHHRLKIVSCIGGFLLAISIVYGAYAHFLNDIFLSLQECILQIFLVAGIMIFTVPVFAEIFKFTEKCCLWKEQKQENSHVTFIKKPVLYFLVVWLLIFLAYMPMFLANWPGNFIYDAKYQIKNVIDNAYSTHHPLLHTWLMGMAYRLGVKWDNVSAGFSLYTLLQMLILTSSFAYCLFYLWKRKVPKYLRIGIFLWFALFPMHPLFAITATKDVLFAAFFLYTFILFIRLFYDKEEFKWYSYLGLLSSSVLLILFRNNAIYAIMPFALVCIIMAKDWKNKGKRWFLFLCIILLASAGNKALMKGLCAREADAYRESLSVPLQGLSRVASYRANELKATYYDEICQYIRAEDIEKYNPYISDPVKNNANEELLKTNTLNFLKLWCHVGLQYPDEYMESFITNTMGYWYPLNQYAFVNMDIALYHTLIGTEHEIIKRNYCPLADAVYTYLFYWGNYKYVPVLGYLFRNAPYFWLIVYSILWCLYKKNNQGLLVLILPLAYLFTCMLGPTSALRYIYCLIVCCPLYMYVILYHAEEKRKKI